MPSPAKLSGDAEEVRSLEVVNRTKAKGAITAPYLWRIVVGSGNFLIPCGTILPPVVNKDGEDERQGTDDGEEFQHDSTLTRL